MIIRKIILSVYSETDFFGGIQVFGLRMCRSMISQIMFWSTWFDWNRRSRRESWY